MLKKTVAFVLLTGFFYSCTPGWSEKELPSETEGYAPVYASAVSAKHITAEAPRATIKGGKIYTTGHLLFQVEQDSGIHVINYTDPVHPQKLGFIRSLLCKEIAVKNGLIYTNNVDDLVVIDINDMNNVREVGRTAAVFPDLVTAYPPKPNQWETIYFECPDPKKGVVTGWELKTIHNPKCWR